MRVFLAGATGVIGRRLVKLLREAHIDVVGTTRTPAKGRALKTLGATPVVVDVFDAQALRAAVEASEADVIVHQLTDLPFAPGTPRYAEGQERNAKLRVEGTRNLVDAAVAAGVRRIIAQSIAFIYAPGEGARNESDPLDPSIDPTRAMTVSGVRALEDAVLRTPGIDGTVLRYGFLYGPGTWYDAPVKPPSVHVDAAAQAALLAIRGRTRGIYNIAEDDGAVSIRKAQQELGFDPKFRMF